MLSNSVSYRFTSSSWTITTQKQPKPFVIRKMNGQLIKDVDQSTETNPESSTRGVSGELVISQIQLS